MFCGCGAADVTVSVLSAEIVVPLCGEMIWKLETEGVSGVVAGVPGVAGVSGPTTVLG